MTNEAERPIPDPNPLLGCHTCDDDHRYKDYWLPRYDDGTGKPTHYDTAVWVCDDCLDSAREELRIHRRTNQHKTLAEWVADD